MNIDASILQLIEQQAVGDQARLLQLLHAQGHRLTQPTLSRHLRKLGVGKRDNRYQRVAVSQLSARITARISVSPPNLVILRTAPGFAQALAVHLDHQPLPFQAGTVAGDDTVFVAVMAPENLSSTREAAALRFASDAVSPSS